MRFGKGASLSSYFISAATCAWTILSGLVGGSPRLSLSTTSMPRTTSPTTVYWPLRWAFEANMMKNWLLAELGPAGAVAVLTVAVLHHEAVDHAMERHIVVKMVARKLLEPLRVIGRDIVAQ